MDTSLPLLRSGTEVLHETNATTFQSRTREIGIRMALGADRARVVALVFGDLMRPVLAGVGMGLAGAVMLSGVMNAIIFKLSPNDPISMAMACLALVMVAGMAVLIPAARAARLDPNITLRAE